MPTDGSAPTGPDIGSLLAAVFDESPVATLRTEIHNGRVGPILEANPAAHLLLGADDLVGRRLADLSVAGSLLEVYGPQIQHLMTVPARDDVHVRWLSVTVVPLSPLASPGRPAALLLLEDVTDRRARDRRLAEAARHDPLTGVGNRDELLSALGALDPIDDGPFVAVLFCDLDRFKRVNDYRGHQAGDEVLKSVARRIRAAVRPQDTLVRLGGDEFVVLCPRLSGIPDARAIAERVRTTLQTPLTIRGRGLRMSMSIGLAIAPVSRVDGHTLLHAADSAMYAAKQAGRNRVGMRPVDMRTEPSGPARWSPMRWMGRRRPG